MSFLNYLFGKNDENTINNDLIKISVKGYAEYSVSTIVDTFIFLSIDGTARLAIDGDSKKFYISNVVTIMECKDEVDAYQKLQNIKGDEGMDKLKHKIVKNVKEALAEERKNKIINGMEKKKIRFEVNFDIDAKKSELE